MRIAQITLFGRKKIWHLSCRSLHVGQQMEIEHVIQQKNGGVKKSLNKMVSRL